MKGVKLAHAGWMVAAFELSGVAGMLISGWMTDRLFGGRGARVCVIFMALAGVSVLLFWKLPSHSVWLSTFLLCLAGFFIYGPQSLIGTAAANLGTKRAAAAAVGLTGLFGYASTLVSGVGVGALAQNYGWDAGFALFAACSMIGVLLLAACWPARAHGYAPIMEEE
jgi:OPA family glycerol-3-phosphate transporter-like MFS transporter/OPA family sugar phosphate sensor protein UhpC-like MFS transporter